MHVWGDCVFVWVLVCSGLCVGVGVCRCVGGVQVCSVVCGVLVCTECGVLVCAGMCECWWMQVYAECDEMC